MQHLSVSFLIASKQCEYNCFDGSVVHVQLLLEPLRKVVELMFAADCNVTSYSSCRFYISSGTQELNIPYSTKLYNYIFIDFGLKKVVFRFKWVNYSGMYN